MFTNLLIFIVASLLQYGLIVLSDWCRSRPPETRFTISEGPLTTTVTCGHLSPDYFEPGDTLSLAGEKYRIVAVNDGSITIDRQAPANWQYSGLRPGCQYFNREVKYIEDDTCHFFNAPPLKMDGKIRTPGVRSVYARDMTTCHWIHKIPVSYVSKNSFTGVVTIGLHNGRTFEARFDQPVSVDAWV